MRVILVLLAAFFATKSCWAFDCSSVRNMEKIFLDEAARVQFISQMGDTPFFREWLASQSTCYFLPRDIRYYQVYDRHLNPGDGWRIPYVCVSRIGRSSTGGIAVKAADCSFYSDSSTNRLFDF